MIPAVPTIEPDRTIDQATASEAEAEHPAAAPDPVLECSLESLPASDPPAWTGAAITAGF